MDEDGRKHKRGHQRESCEPLPDLRGGLGCKPQVVGMDGPPLGVQPTLPSSPQGNALPLKRPCASAPPGDPGRTRIRQRLHDLEIHPGFASRRNPHILVIDTDTKDPQSVEQQYKKPRSAAVDHSTEPSLKTMYHRSSTYNVERQPTHAIFPLPDLHRK